MDLGKGDKSHSCSTGLERAFLLDLSPLSATLVLIFGWPSG